MVELLRKNPRKQYFCVLDTETATIRKADEIARIGMNPDDVDGIAKRKQKIAIAKPLVYDIGWVIVDRVGTVYKKVNYLVSEVFFDLELFNTGYYANKRPIYMEMLAKGECVAKCWNQIIEELMEDLAECNFACAYNATFDFKKAIPYTERYMEKYLGVTIEDKKAFSRWEWGQEQSAKRIVRGEASDKKNADFLNPTFKLRGIEIPIIDLWGLACDRLINIDKYRKFCLEYGLLTNSKEYFKTSAETSYRYLENMYEFVESHTALDDAEIEARILVKALRRGKAESFLVAFPFKMLGTTVDFVCEKAPSYADSLIAEFETYLDSVNPSAYKTRIENKVARLYTL